MVVCEWVSEWKGDFWSCLLQLLRWKSYLWLIIWLGLKYRWPLHWYCSIIDVWLVCQYSFITIYVCNIQLGSKRRIILRELKYLRLSSCYLRGTCLIDRSLPGNCCLSSATKGSRQEHFLFIKSCFRGSNSYTKQYWDLPVENRMTKWAEYDNSIIINDDIIYLKSLSAFLLSKI